MGEYYIHIKKTNQPINQLIIVKNLESVDKNRFNDADLPSRVGNIATRVRSQKGRAS